MGSYRMQRVSLQRIWVNVDRCWSYRKNNRKNSRIYFLKKDRLFDRMFSKSSKMRKLSNSLLLSKWSKATLTWTYNKYLEISNKKCHSSISLTCGLRILGLILISQQQCTASSREHWLQKVSSGLSNTELLNCFKPTNDHRFPL